MKGITDVEFILSVMVFLGVITFVTFNIVSNVPLLRAEAVADNLRARSYEISQLLMFDQGEPANWNYTNVTRIGLATPDRYVLSAGKIANLSLFCANYAKLKWALGENITDVKINITNSNGAVIANCGPNITKTSRPDFQITRFGVLRTKEIVKIVVDVF